MAGVRALVVYDLGTPLDPVQKILAERRLSVHLSASWEDAERAYSILDIKYIFADVTMCHGERWEKFVYRSRIGGAKSSLIVFNSEFPQNLHHLLGCQSRPTLFELAHIEPSDPLVIAHSPRLREAFDLAARYAKHDVTVMITGDTGTGKEVLARHVVR